MEPERLELPDDDVPEVVPDAEALWVPTALAVRGFRGAADVVLDLADVPVTVLVGPNGAGKTSVLEAVSWLLTGNVLTEAGTRVEAGDYAPESGGDTLVRLQLRDATGKSEPAEVFVQRTLSPHRITIGAVGGAGHECGTRDAPDVLKMATGLDVSALSHLMVADRFVRLRSQDQRQYLLDLVGGAGRQVNLVAVADDELQRALATAATETVGEITSADDVQAAIKLAGERRAEADRNAKAATERATEATGALTEALAEIAEAGYEGTTLDELEAAIADATVVARAALEEAREQLTARTACEQRMKSAEEAISTARHDLGSEQQKLIDIGEEREAVEAQRTTAAQAVENARQVVAAAQTAYDEALEGARVGQAAEVERLRDVADALAEEIDPLAKAEAVCSDAHEEGRVAAALAAERLESLRDLLDSGLCPTCERPTDDADFADKISTLATDHQAQLQAQELAGVHLDAATNAVAEARLAHKGARDDLAEAQGRDVDPAPERNGLAAAEVTLEQAEAALAAVPVLADEETTTARVAELQARIDGLRAEIGHDEPKLTLYPEDIAERVQTLDEALQAHTLMTESLKRARDREGQALAATAEQTNEEGYRLAWDRLKRAWEGLLGESLTGAGELDPLLEDVSAILRPVRDWEAAWTADGPVVLGRGVTRAFARLSDGERLVAGAAWQAALARRVGLGAALIDHAAEIDGDALVELIAALVSMSSETGVQFLVARPTLPMETCEGCRGGGCAACDGVGLVPIEFAGGVQIVPLADGRLA